jgi:hypothetical protein
MKNLLLTGALVLPVSALFFKASLSKYEESSKNLNT